MTSDSLQRVDTALLTRFCLTVPAAILAINALLLFGLLGTGNNLPSAIDKSGIVALVGLTRATGGDSWDNLAAAHLEARADVGNMYRSLHVIEPGSDLKFQYPPTALLLYEWLPEGTIQSRQSVAYGTTINAVLSWMSRLAIAATIAISALCIFLASTRLGQHQNFSSRQKIIIFVCYCIAGLLFYPLLFAHSLGQIQVFLNLLLVLSLLTWMKGARFTAGVLVGVCSLVKPQYGAALVWAILVGQWRFMFAMIATGLLGLTASLYTFGLDPHLQYLSELLRLSRLGESYWANQTMNGLLNRLLEAGHPFNWGGFPEYNRVVHVVTTVSSLTILLIAFAVANRTAWRSSRKRPSSVSIYGFGAVLAGITLASPIAWEHHYGFFLGLFACLLPLAAMQWRSRGRWMALALLLSFVAMGCVYRNPERLFSNEVLGFLASHLYFGALLVFGMLVLASRGVSQIEPAFDAKPVAA